MPHLLAGLSAFPLTPFADGGRGGVDERAAGALVERLVGSGVDSVTVLGSTGSYAYLDREERSRVVEVAVSAASGAVPVLAGIGATRTRDVLRHADDAQAAGAVGLLLAPVSYQPLTDDDVLGLYRDVDAAVSVPLVVYDNPGTTHVAFSDDLHARVAALPHVVGVKIPPVAGGPGVLGERVHALRGRLPAGHAVAISGDPVAAEGLAAGCDGWCSVLAGTLPGPCRALVDAVAAGDLDAVAAWGERLAPLWALFAAHGSYRVVAAVAEELGLVPGPCLPRPVLGLDATARERVRAALAHLGAAADPGGVSPG